MALKLGLRQNGQWYSRGLNCADMQDAMRQAESLFASTSGAETMEIYDDNLYNMKGKWVFLTYTRGRWSDFNSPPKKSADGYT